MYMCIYIYIHKYLHDVREQPSAEHAAHQQLIVLYVYNTCISLSLYIYLYTYICIICIVCIYIYVYTYVCIIYTHICIHTYVLVCVGGLPAVLVVGLGEADYIR